MFPFIWVLRIIIEGKDCVMCNWKILNGFGSHKSFRLQVVIIQGKEISVYQTCN